MRTFMAVLITGFIASGAAGEIIVYDGFSDAPSTNVPAGWASNEPANNHGYVAAGSLSYPETASSNNSFGLGNKTADYTKTFSSVTLAGGESIYFSALIRMNGGFTKNFGAGGVFRLYDTANPFGNAINVGLGTSSYTSNLMGFSIHNRSGDWASTSSVKAAGTYVMSNVTHLIVGSYTRGTGGKGTGSIKLWVDPAVTADPGAPTAALASYAEIENYNTFQILSSGSGSFPGSWQLDEFKIGKTWSDVVSSSIPSALAPVAAFNANPLSGTAPLSVTFSDISGGTVTNRLWDFGDGAATNTALASFVHTYATSGTYTVRLIVSGPVGTDTNIQTNIITVTEPVAPVAGFSFTPASGEAPLAVFFTDTSTGTITNRLWDFGDGVTTNTALTNLVHTYASPGTYSVRLTASGLAGTDTLLKSNSISVAASTAINISADKADQYVTESATPVFAWTGAGTARLGDDASNNRYTYVIPFKLPDLHGDVVSDVRLKVFLQTKASYSTATNIYIDVLGGRVDASPAVTIADCNATTAVLKDNVQIVNNTVVFPQAQTHTLDAAFFRNIYANDANAAGKYVFITMRVDNIDPYASMSYVEYVAADGTANTPLLLFSTDRGGATGIRLDLFTGAF